MNELLRVNEEKCRQLAELLKRCPIPQPTEEGSLEGLTSVQLPDFYFVVVAICHQTSPAGRARLSGVVGSGETLYGWDYLRKRFGERAQEDPTLLKPSRWRTMTANDVGEIFADTAGIKTLTGSDRRGELIRDIGEGYERLGIRTISDLYCYCDGWLARGQGGGLYSCLSEFLAYRDPVKKKSCYFLELMRAQCKWKYQDPENLGPPVDYHEVRGHLRIGTVILSDMNLKKRISGGQPVDAHEDEAIRKAVYDAICLISRLHGSCDPAALHYLFWNAFRNCCARDYQHCSECGSCCTLPPRYSEAFRIVERGRCVFATICDSAGKTGKLIEHQHETDYY